MDRTTINLASLLLGGSGLYAALTAYQHPGQSATFVGSNPYAKKAAAINNVMTKAYAGVAMLGLLFQAAAEVAGETIPARQLTTIGYCVLFALASIATLVLFWIVGRLGRAFARRRWQPVVISSHRDKFIVAQFIVTHDGWRAAQLAAKEPLQDPQQYRDANFRAAEEHISQIEALLEMPTGPSDLAARIDRLEVFFKK